MKKKWRLTGTVKTNSLLPLLSVCLALFSCGNNQSVMEGDEMQDQDMVQDIAMQEDNSGMMEGEGMMGDEGMMQDGMMEGEGMMGDEGMMQDGMMSEEIHNAMMSRDMGPEMMEDLMVIRKLLMQHVKIDRRVENLDNGVKTWTTSDDPQIAGTLQKHVRQMHERIKEKEPFQADGSAVS